MLAAIGNKTKLAKIFLYMAFFPGYEVYVCHYMHASGIIEIKVWYDFKFYLQKLKLGFLQGATRIVISILAGLSVLPVDIAILIYSGRNLTPDHQLNSF